MAFGISVQGAGTDLTDRYLNTQYRTSPGLLGFFENAGALYQFVFYEPGGAGVRAIAAIKSTDGGLTWTPQDTANQPADGFCSGGNTQKIGTAVTICFVSAAVPAGALPLQLIDFDLATDSWGAVYGTTGAPTTSAASSSSPGPVSFRSGSDTLAVLYLGDGGGTGLTLSVYDRAADTWNAPADAGVNVTALAGWNPAITSVAFYTAIADADDNTYLFFYTRSSDTSWDFRTFFQLIEPDDSTPATGGAFFDFPGQGVTHPDMEATDQGIFGVPVIVGTNIVLPIGRADLVARPIGGIDYASCYVGVGIPTPSAWNESDIPTDPAYTVGDPGFLNVLNQAGMGLYDGSKLYIAYLGSADLINNTPNWSQLRICSTTPTGDDPNAWTWQAITETDYTTPPFDAFVWTFSHSLFEQPTIGGNGAALVGVNLFSGSDSGSFFFVPAGASAGIFQGTFAGFWNRGHFGGGTK